MNAPEDMTTAELNSRLDELTTELGRRHDSMLAANGRDDGARISSPIGPALSAWPSAWSSRSCAPDGERVPRCDPAVAQRGVYLLDLPGPWADGVYLTADDAGHHNLLVDAVILCKVTE